MPRGPLPSDEAVEAAISKVLSAEREAHESVAACRRHAEERLDSARRQARLISERCALRIQAVRQRHAQVLAERLSAFQDESSQLRKEHVPTAEEMARLRRAVAAVADDSTGEIP